MVFWPADRLFQLLHEENVSCAMQCVGGLESIDWAVQHQAVAAGLTGPMSRVSAVGRSLLLGLGRRRLAPWPSLQLHQAAPLHLRCGSPKHLHLPGDCSGQAAYACTPEHLTVMSWQRRCLFQQVSCASHRPFSATGLPVELLGRALGAMCSACPRQANCAYPRESAWTQGLIVDMTHAPLP